MLFASIDIGTNAVRLLFANVFENNGIARADKATLLRIPVRLGMDVFNEGLISPQRKENLIKTLKAFKLLLDVYEPIDFRACATSAMREASNGNEIIEHIFSETGINIEIIDGLEEAKIISATNDMVSSQIDTDILYVDVGGGSTELSLFSGRDFINSASFKLGTIRILQEKDTKKEWKAMKEWVGKFVKPRPSVSCIGSGGNINKITKLFGDIPSKTITQDQLLGSYNYLTSLSLEERIQELGLRPDRADVIVPAASVFINVLEWSGLDFVIAPKIGLADGLVLMLYDKYKGKG